MTAARRYPNVRAKGHTMIDLKHLHCFGAKIDGVIRPEMIRDSEWAVKKVVLENCGIRFGGLDPTYEFIDCVWKAYVRPDAPVEIVPLKVTQVEHAI